jgi:hypothetical protein
LAEFFLVADRIPVVIFILGPIKLGIFEHWRRWRSDDSSVAGIGSIVCFDSEWQTPAFLATVAQGSTQGLGSGWAPTAAWLRDQRRVNGGVNSDILPV